MNDLLIDTNVLLLLIVGTSNAGSIPKHRRTTQFSTEDFVLLCDCIKRYRRVLTTPPILTEASNLLGNDFHETIAPTVTALCDSFIEIIHPKERLLSEEAFSRLGYADVSILSALDDRTTVMTDDAALYAQALYQGDDAVNFNHVRSR